MTNTSTLFYLVDDLADTPVITFTDDLDQILSSAFLEEFFAKAEIDPGNDLVQNILKDSVV